MRKSQRSKARDVMKQQLKVSKLKEKITGLVREYHKEEEYLKELENDLVGKTDNDEEEGE